MKLARSLLALSAGICTAIFLSNNNDDTPRERRESEPRMHIGRTYKPSKKEKEKVYEYDIKVEPLRICKACEGKVKYPTTIWCPYCGTVL